MYFAAERTLLAWLRTGLGLIGVGFAVSRFGLFMRELAASKSGSAVPATGLSALAGVALVSLGVVVNLSAVLRHVQLIRELRTGSWAPGHVSREAVALGIILALMGAAMAAYLLLVR